MELLRQKGCAEQEDYIYSMKRCNDPHKRVMENAKLDNCQIKYQDNEMLFYQLQGDIPSSLEKIIT